MNLEKKYWSAITIIEIARDMYCFVFILEVKKRMKNLESKEYISLLLKDIIPILIYELSVSLDDIKALKKDEFYRPGMNKKVREERARVLKKISVNSSESDCVAKEMGLNFSEKVYDINVKVLNGFLQDMNYELFFEKNIDYDFWNSLFEMPGDILPAITKSLNFDVDIDSFFKKMDNALTIIAKAMDENLNGKKYSYSVYRLFSNNDSLLKEDKYFILYRYRLITAIQNIEVFLPLYDIKDVKESMYDFHAFFRKWKAVVIEIIGRDLLNLNTPFSDSIKNKIDNEIIDKRFFSLNRKIRNNIHYTETEKLCSNDLSIVDAFQDVYLNIIKQSFDEVIFVDIDDEVKRMTGFSSAFLQKGISKDKFLKYYAWYYLKYRIFKHL